MPTHDFDALRQELNLPRGVGLLEAAAQLPAAESSALLERISCWERGHAERARAQPGAERLLEELAARGARRGILTRNTHEHARLTLKASGLEQFFEVGDIIGREAAPAKPAPDGILALLKRWEARAPEAVMAGDYLFDLQAGRAAGTRTLYIDGDGLFPHRGSADESLRSWSEWLDSEKS